jgi:geranylgeranylglycerol-phosphate geranylgeranyltransferase
MRLLNYIFLLFPFVNGLAAPQRAVQITQMNMFEAYDFTPPFQPIMDKIGSVKKIIRANNILPATMLCFTGGWIAQPNVLKMFRSVPFRASIAITLLVMSGSMIINDLFDIKADRINNPTRPLITGEITKREAVGLSVAMLVGAKLLGSRYLPRYLATTANIATVAVVLYTPLFKRIPFIKNIFCASVVSYSVMFSGLAANPTIVMDHKTAQLFTMVNVFLFCSSLCNEILLDMHDVIGDRANRIYTLPVIFGMDTTWRFLNVVLYFNVLMNSLLITSGFGYFNSIPFLIICSQLIENLNKIRTFGYDKFVIYRVIRSNQGPFLMALLYLALLRI